MTAWLAAMLALSAGGCATWKTLTFSPDENSDKTKNQTAQLYYLGKSPASTEKLKSIFDKMPQAGRGEIDSAFINCGIEQPGAGVEAVPLLLLAPVAAKYVFDVGADALAGYAEGLQTRGNRGYSASVILSGEDAKTITAGTAEHPGCLVLLRIETDGETAKPGMVTIIRLVLHENIIRFEPVYVRFENAMALTGRDERGGGGRIDALYAISASVARPAKPGAYPKQVLLGVGEFSLAGVQLGPKAALNCGAQDRPPCLVQTKSIDRPDNESTSIEMSVAVREIGTQVNDAKRAEAEIKTIKEAVGPKIQEYVGGLVTKLNAKE